MLHSNFSHTHPSIKPHTIKTPTISPYLLLLSIIIYYNYPYLHHRRLFLATDHKDIVPTILSECLQHSLQFRAEPVPLRVTGGHGEGHQLVGLLRCVYEGACGVM